MGEPSDIKRGDIKAEGVAPADDKVAATADERMAIVRRWLGGPMIAQHWRGELPLSVSFWIGGFLVLLMFNLILWPLEWAGERLTSMPLVVTAALAFCMAMLVWYFIGVWRAAGRFTGSLIWPIAARLLVGWWALQWLYLLIRSDLPGQ